MGVLGILRILLIIPTLNESESIQKLLGSLDNLKEIFDVLIVDDDSDDETISMVIGFATQSSRKIDFIVRKNHTDGLAGAYVRGYVEAAKRGYSHVMQMDADGQHRPEDLINLINSAKNDGYVIGSRYCKDGRTEGWPTSRLIISRLGNLYFSLLFSSKIKDSTGGFRLAPVSDLQLMWRTPPMSRGFTFHAESTFRALIHNLKVVETPIVFVSRNAGDSKMSIKNGLESLKLMTSWKFLKRKTNV